MRCLPSVANHFKTDFPFPEVKYEDSAYALLCVCYTEMSEEDLPYACCPTARW